MAARIAFVGFEPDEKPLTRARRPKQLQRKRSSRKHGKVLGCPTRLWEKKPAQLRIKSGGEPGRGLRARGEEVLRASLEARIRSEQQHIQGAEWRHPAFRARRRPTLQAQGIGDTTPDDFLDRIPSPQDRPWCYCCCLEIFEENGKRFGGSGFLINHNTVVTAGHNVYDPEKKRWAARIDVFPARNGSSGTTRIAVARRNFYSVRGWTDNAANASDFAALKLTESVTTGSFGCQVVSDQDLESLLVTVAGYPTRPPTGTHGFMWGQDHFVESFTDHIVSYEVATRRGMSGCPVFFTLDGNRYVIGIHMMGDEVSNGQAVRVTRDVLDYFLQWRDTPVR
jgi:V8-like Glu-specific endopeptidase